MIIFVYGDNSYLAQQHVNKMRTKFVEQIDSSGMNLSEFHGQSGKIELGAVMQSVKTPPFLGEKRMVIVKGLLEDITTKPKGIPWVESLEKNPESTILILFDKISIAKLERNYIYKSLVGKKDVHSYSFPTMDDRKLYAWALTFAKEIKLSISGALLNGLVAMVGNDLWQLSSELKKLKGYSGEGEVTQGMINDLVSVNFHDAMFDLVDSISKGDPKIAFRMLKEQRLSGSADFHIFSMISRQVRLLLGARALLETDPYINKSDVAKELGVHPFVAQKTLAQSKNFKLNSLKVIHGMLFDFDKKMKSSQISVDVAIDRIIAEMMH